MRKSEEFMSEYKVNTTDVVMESAISEDEEARIFAATMKKIEAEKASMQGKETQGFKEINMERKEIFKAAPSSYSRGTRRRMIALIAAVVLCLGTVCGFATGYLNVSDSFKEFLGIDNDEVVAGMGKNLDVQVTDKGWTVDFKEVLGDAQSVYILYDVIAPEGTALDPEKYYSFIESRVTLPTVNGGGGGWYSDQLPDENPEDNKLSYILSIECSKQMSGKTIGVELGRFAYYDSDTYDDVDVTDANFKADLDLDYKVSSKTVKVGKTINIEGDSEYLKNIEISPISIMLKGRITTDKVGELTIEGDDAIKIHLADGTIINEYRGAGSDSRNGKRTHIYSFYQVVDISQVVGVTIGDEYIEF